MKRVFVALSLIAVLAPAAAAAAESEPPAEISLRRSGCPGVDNRRASEHKREDAMRCLINRVRERAGVRGLQSNRSLERAAGGKVGDVVRCGLSHTACGEAADAWARRTGYIDGGSFKWGENLARGKGGRGTAKSVLRAWMGSPPHRETLLTGAFEHLGLGLKTEGKNAVWVLQLGCRGC